MSIAASAAAVYVTTAETAALPNDLVDNTIRANGLGFPRINFEDGRPVNNSDGRESGSGQARMLTAADFDSDGTADLVTVDSGGSVWFYKGNVNSIFPISSQAEDQETVSTNAESPFFKGKLLFSMAVVPDYLEIGDFNADGFPDILAAARGGDSIYVSIGDGNGGFVHTTEFKLPGSITALAVGEIGRADGQADAAIAITGSAGSRLIVFENPYGSFSHPPEILELESAATSIALGNLDLDTFADIAVAGGNRLTVVQGRGHTQPWDRIETKIERPSAVVSTRVMPFEIADISVGRFSKGRRDSVALLTTDGMIATVTCPDISKRKGFRPGNAAEKQQILPVGSSEKGFSDHAEYQVPTKLVTDVNEIPGDVRILEAGKRFDELKSAKRPEPTPDKVAMEDVISVTNADASTNSSKENFILSNSPSPAPTLENWRLEFGIQDTKLIGSASRQESRKMVKVRVSTSGREDLALIDHEALHIYLWPDEKRGIAADVVSFDAASSPTAVLPMRLNQDALSDLVVLQEGSSIPSVLMTAPATTYVVNSTADSNTCSGGTCTLRGAIIAANASFGADMITFAVGPGSSFTPSTTYPTISETVTIDGSTAPGYVNQPVISIWGTIPLGASGFAVNAPNCAIRGLAITNFRRQITGSSSIGGFGITIFNFGGEDETVNTLVEGNFLGVDLGGSGDQGNESAGLQIFDSDFNIIGGNAPLARNVISGNGNGEIANGNRSAPGILVIDGRSNLIRGNYIGVTAAGTAARSNSVGIFLTGSNNEIGGDPAGSANVISGNRHSIPDSEDPNACQGDGITEATVYNKETGEFITHDNRFKGNRIGTNAAGNQGIGNCRSGIRTNRYNSPTVGSITAGGRNTVSGNSLGGIYCSTRPPWIGFSSQFPIWSGEGSGPTPPSGFCNIAGNNVGTDITGNASIPNNFDKATSPFAMCTGGGACMILMYVWGNVIADSEGTYSTIGGPGGTSSASCTGFCNLVSGNRRLDPSIWGPENIPAISVMALTEYEEPKKPENIQPGEVGIFNNYVGTNISGTAALSNPGGGISASGRSRIGGTFTDIGGAIGGLGNLISGNTNPSIFEKAVGIRTIGFFNGIEFDYSIVRNNFIGTDRTGTVAIPNDTGIWSDGNGSAIIIGGDDPIDRNIVSGNLGHGIEFGGLTTPLRNNYIGVNVNGDPLGNGGSGVVFNDSFNWVGDAGIGNVIANNSGSGVLVARGPFSNSPFRRGNRIRFNKIYNNGGLGIDLSMDDTFPFEGDGVTENDCGDPDVGPNGLQNFPILTSPQNNGDGTLTVGGALDSRPSASYTLDFYSNSVADPSGYGEGETYIGSTQVTTDEDGIVAFLWTSDLPVPPGTFISATATDSEGSTSEFSCIAGQCSVSGVTLDEQIESARKAVGGGCEIAIIVNINTDESDPNPADGICDVDLSSSGSQCSLRAAIQTANAIPGTNLINFDIPGGGGVQTLSPTSALPDITSRVFINATTQPGYSGTPVIELRGNLSGSDGLVFAAGSAGSSLKGMTINRFKTSGGNARAGVVLLSDDNKVENCIIGLMSDGLQVDGENIQDIGIRVERANNTIGGQRGSGNTPNNVIAGNSISNVFITGLPAGRNKIKGNNIGLNLNNLPLESASSVGIYLKESVTRTEIGGGSASESNIISANTGIRIQNTEPGGLSDGLNVISGNSIAGCDPAGISIEDSGQNTIGGVLGSDSNYFWGNSTAILINNEGTLGFLVDENWIFGNFIGMRPDSNYIGNEFGIAIYKAENNFIGDGTSEHKNIIVSNGSGITLAETTKRNVVQGNHIGIDAGGTEEHGNDRGVTIYGLENRVVGNVISGNGTGVSGGVISVGQFADGNIIEQNRIGLAANSDSAIPNNTGISLFTGKSIVRNNTISGNSDNGISIFGNENTVTNNRIGTNSAGTAVIGGPPDDRQDGIHLIGTLNIVSGNTISGNSRGVQVFRGSSTDPIPSNNRIEGNFIGTNASGTAGLGNLSDGVYLSNNAIDNKIGGLTPGAGNVISGNGHNGIRIAHFSNPGEVAPFENKIQGNRIGTDVTGNSAIANGRAGVKISGGISNRIGGAGAEMPAARNIISGNTDDGVQIVDGSAVNRIMGNYIGTRADGTSALGNGRNGIFVDTSAVGTQIGGTEPNSENIVAFNAANGIQMSGGTTPFASRGTTDGIPQTVILKSRILSNGENGILIDTSTGVKIGDAGAGNEIAGNQQDGIGLSNSDEIEVYSNSIGFYEEAVIQILGNGGNGISSSQSNNISVGDLDNARTNIVVASGQYGILLDQLTEILRIRNNLVGTIVRNLPRRSHPGNGNPDGQLYGNQLGGILISNGSRLNVVGGPQLNSGNVVANNGGPGVWIDETAGTGNLVDPNSIYGNLGLGIDVGQLGPNPNDPTDADVGPNNLQNHPVIVSRQLVNGDLILTFNVDSAPEHSAYGKNGIYVEFFRSDLTGQGETFIGSTFYTLADYNSLAPGAKTVNLGPIATLGINPNDPITSTATDAEGNTSEFSPVAFGPTSVGVKVSGRVLTASGSSIRGTTVTITDENGVVRSAVTSSLGYYAFEGITAGRTYVVTAVSRRYRFTPRIVNIADPISDLDLIALE
ncbi:MAG: VCBS repeat-containing protein [Acidobacteria bacterium]|nr:VCBS repeat-containing protein [Acidobacteriota bacterium]